MRTRLPAITTSRRKRSTAVYCGEPPIPAQSLARLLQGSGMTYRFVDAKTLTVEQSPSNLKKQLMSKKRQNRNPAVIRLCRNARTADQL